MVVLIGNISCLSQLFLCLLSTIGGWRLAVGGWRLAVGVIGATGVTGVTGVAGIIGVIGVTGPKGLGSLAQASACVAIFITRLGLKDR